IYTKERELCKSAKAGSRRQISRFIRETMLAEILSFRKGGVK
ncbi:unnamed protein product, partial [marine sediment metagenome]